jgi:hypothetical protein
MPEILQGNLSFQFIEFYIDWLTKKTDRLSNKKGHMPNDTNFKTRNWKWCSTRINHVSIWEIYFNEIYSVNKRT